jgi:hypothetical protein
MHKKYLIKKLVPTNYLEEKEKFFADNSYNPQFQYSTEINSKDMLRYGTVQEDMLDKAKIILKKTFNKYSETELYNLKGKVLKKNEVVSKISNYMKNHNILNKYEIKTSNTLSARTMMTPNEIILRTPISYREEGLMGMLHHELGTHALRGINYENQPWYKKKDEYDFSQYLRTEEGLASLHSLFAHTYISLFIPATRYLASSIAQKSSFVETWNQLKPYVDNKERLWTLVFRQKRGLEDTSLPGGFTKDIVYFEGTVEVYNWLVENNFDIAPLYFGKMSYKDVKKSQKFNPNFKPQLPLFFTEDKDKYKNKILEIGKWNEL